MWLIQYVLFLFWVTTLHVFVFILHSQGFERILSYISRANFVYIEYETNRKEIVLN